MPSALRLPRSTWSSLTEDQLHSYVAREITGTRWSGPAFFGLYGGKA